MPLYGKLRIIAAQYMSPQSLPSKIGRYEILDRLGAGGMGVVYLATDPLLRRTVAIKVLPADNEEHRERFAREARSAASIRHSNVVTIYDVGEHEDQPFIAMEFLDGESMSEMIHRQAPLPLERRIQLIIELCAGLGHAHRSGIVHRDIKPGNLMITTEGSLKILDFGLARLTAGASQAGLTRVGAIMGTPHYMSPEQVRGETVDARSDIFSVGLVLYELLSYTKAFSGDSAPVVLHNILHKTPAPIRTLLPQIDDELEGIVGRAIEKDLDKRYPDLAAFGADLTRFRAGLLRSPSDAIRRRSAGVTNPGGNLDATLVRPYRNLDALAQRRASQIASCLHAAMKQFEAGNFDGAIAECENALLLNPQEGPALELLDKVQHAVEDARVNQWLEEARALITGGELTAAEALIDQSLKLRSASDGAQALQRELKEKRRNRERVLENQRAAQAAIVRARGHLAEGAFEAAIRCASEALGYDANNADARTLKEEATAAIDRRKREERKPDPKQAATALIEQSRAMMASGDLSGAATLLKSFEPQPLVAGALLEIQAQTAQRDADRKRREQEKSLEGTINVPPPARETERLRPKPVLPAPVERRMSPFVAGLVALVVVSGGLGWYFMSRPESSQSTQGGGEPLPEDFSAVLSAAQEQYKNRNEREAIATLAKIPPGNAAAEQLLRTIRGDAEARAASARSAADAANKSNVEPYSAALQKQQEATALGTTAQDTERVVALLDQATTLFATALKSGSSTQGVVVQKTDAPPVDPVAGGLTDQQRRQVARLIEEAQRQLSDGEYDAAITAYESALRIDPTNTRAANGIVGTRKAQAAEIATLEALKKKPGF